MENFYEASRYTRYADDDHVYQQFNFSTAEEAVAFAEAGTGGNIIKVANGKTIAAWVCEDRKWFSINIYSGHGARTKEERPS